MILAYTQGHRIITKLMLGSHSVVKWHEAAQTFAVVYHVKEVTSNKTCQYGEYGSFEQLLFLFIDFFVIIKT